MGHFSDMFNGLARSLSIRKDKNCSWTGNDGAEGTAETTAKETRKNKLILRSSGVVNAEGSKNFASVFSKRGEKGMNQDCFIVWEEFGCQVDTIFCGIFDGHGPWGHYVAKKVRESMPLSLLCNWEEAIAAQSTTDPDFNIELQPFSLWESCYVKTCAAIDRELEQDHDIDSFFSGATGLSIVKQGEQIIIANIGDSRAVLATTSDDGDLVPIQLTVDFKPNQPREAERIIRRQGQVFCLQDEPGVYRIWLPEGGMPGLAMSRAFGDYCMKDFGLISLPEVTQWNITCRDQFIVLATDGVWDVISNEEAVQIVSSTPDRAKAAKSLVKCAAHAWRRKRRGVAMDDISAICLFFDTSSLSQQFDSCGSCQLIET